MPSSDQCAISLDGNLLPASEINFYHDVDSVAPLPPTSKLSIASVVWIPEQSYQDVNMQTARPQRKGTRTAYAAAIQAEREDEDGHLIARAAPKASRVCAPKQTPSHESTSDSTDDTFATESEAESSSDNDFSIDIPNIEVCIIHCYQSAI